MFTSQEDPLRLAYMVASIMNLEAHARAGVARSADARRSVAAWCTAGCRMKWKCWNLRNKITEEARGEMSKEQRDYILRQQKRAIEQELGEKNPDQAEVESLREKLPRPICRKTCARKPSANWGVWKR